MRNSRIRALQLLAMMLLPGACVPPPVAELESLPRVPPGPAEVLIFTGASSWYPEVDSLARILREHGTSVTFADSGHLDEMSPEQLESYGLVIFPGGNSFTMTASVRPETRRKLQVAVRERGVSYLGFCAGAWAAIAPEERNGGITTGSFGIVEGPIQEFTEMAKRGEPHGVQRADFPDGSRREMLWYGGPVTPDIRGGVIARYSDGKAAITQMHSGNGFVIVSGLHPAATPEVFSSLGHTDGDGVDFDLAWKLVKAALKKEPMNAF